MSRTLSQDACNVDDPRRSLKARALRMLAQREQSRSELQRKLTRYAVQGGDAAGGAASADVDTEVKSLLDWLEAQGLLSNERFVESRVNARGARFGNLRIRQELAQHGLELGAGVALELDRTEVQRARALRERRFGEVSTDRALQIRQMRFLASRGFSAAAIRAATRPGEVEEDDVDRG